MQKPPFQLSTRQEVQVTLLYYFASLDYLKGLQQRLHALAAPGTSNKWCGNGWQFLADFELSVASDIVKRAYQTYSITGAYQCGRGMAEMSLGLAPEEQSEFDRRFEELSAYAGNIDDTMNQTQQAGRWDDFSLARECQKFPEALAQAPALQLRADITGGTGMVPARTGVYLPIDDPHGTPQFCWIGKPAGPLLECSTFNDLGLDAWAAVGPIDLWVNDDSMHAFVQDHLNDPRLTRDPFFAYSATKAELAPSLVARNAFTSRPCDWIFVEQIQGELCGIQP
ncbi:hypothetical protein [Rugamonas aquatica]|uniref:Uncharacterized protein n=1 Tax=Rugamonas aquatica TaxID=2743357 RepID=A0A6A7MVP7_9BURK|nr:hypothetical protein [Rugamonas aquatica]MQA36760.1 hypothetical protein [Rugamonas aquatica]